MVDINGRNSRLYQQSKMQIELKNIEINPKNFQEEYLKYLNQCFNNWGSVKECDWAFKRVVGDLEPDILIIKNENDEVIAGVGIFYRKLVNQTGSIIDIAIAGGGWTLPKARRTGCLSKLLEISHEISAKKNVPFLTSFVMENNTSYGRVKNTGALLIPTYILFSPHKPYSDAIDFSIELIKNQKQVISEVYNKFCKTKNEFVNFSYTIEEFYQQYINRGKNIEIVKIFNDYAIIEETEDTVKVLLITYNNINSFENNIKSLTNWGLLYRSKKLLFFSSRKEIADICQILDFEKQHGYFSILSTSKDSVHNLDLFTQININMGDKM